MRLPVAAKMALHSAGIDRRQRRLAETGRRMVGGEEMHIDRRRLIHPQRLHGVEIRLHDTAAIDA